MRAFLGLLSTLILFLTPFLTMGVFAEERKRGTMELLMTSPITEIQIVLGKFLASFHCSRSCFCPRPATSFTCISTASRCRRGACCSRATREYCCSGRLLALGTFISSLTENQLIAAVLTFVAFLFLWVMDLGQSPRWPAARAAISSSSAITTISLAAS